jgi:hypothetical protein
VSEGASAGFRRVSFNCCEYFYSAHNRNPDGSDGVLRRTGDIDGPADFLQSIPAGARWITVYPHGPGTDGQPVLVEPSGHDGAFRAIAGAGGKLNYLKLRGVRSAAGYKAEASQRAVSAKEETKRQRDRDREARRDKSKSMAQAVLNASVGDQEAGNPWVSSSAAGRHPGLDRAISVTPVLPWANRSIRLVLLSY